MKQFQAMGIDFADGLAFPILGPILPKPRIVTFHKSFYPTLTSLAHPI